MRIALSLLSCVIPYALLAATVNVRDLGAKGDSKADDSAAIQSALDNKSRPLVVFIPDGNYRIVTTLKVPSGVNIKATAKARLFVCGETPHKRGDFLLANANPAGGDSDISIEGGVWDGNNQGRLNKKDPDLFNTNAWSCATLNFRNVKRLRLVDMTLANSVTYNIRMCQLDGFEIRHIRFSSARKAYNQDGLHFNGEVRHGVVTDIRAISKGQTNDDLLALNADDSLSRLENLDMVCGPIEDIVFRDIYAEDCHTAVRLLSVFSPIRDIRIENITAGCRCYAINADAARYCRTPLFKDRDRPNGVGLLQNVTIRGMTAWATAKSPNPLCCLESNTDGLRLEKFKRDLPKDADRARPFLQIRNIAPVALTGTQDGKPVSLSLGNREDRVFPDTFTALSVKCATPISDCGTQKNQVQ